MKIRDFKQVILAFFVVVILSLSYLFFLYMYKLSTTKNYNEDDLVISTKTINNIEINDSLPLSDKMAKSLDITDIYDGIEGYIEFSIKNKADSPVNYEIYAIKNEIEDGIDERFVKIYLTDSEGKPVGTYDKSYAPTFYSLRFLNDLPAGRSIYKGTLDDHDTDKFILRTWVSDGYPYRTKEKKFSFSLDVRPV